VRDVVHPRLFHLLLKAWISLGGESELWLFFRYKDRARDDRRELIALFVVNLLLVYTHYFGWLVVAGEALVLLVGRRDKVRPFALSTAALLLMFGPWAYLVARTAHGRGGLASNIGSFARPSLLGDLGGFYALLTGVSDCRVLSVVGVTLINIPELCHGAADDGGGGVARIRDSGPFVRL